VISQSHDIPKLPFSKISSSSSYLTAKLTNLNEWDLDLSFNVKVIDVKTYQHLLYWDPLRNIFTNFLGGHEMPKLGLLRVSIIVCLHSILRSSDDLEG
jgi:hypothetical protein